MAWLVATALEATRTSTRAAASHGGKVERATAVRALVVGGLLVVLGVVVVVRSPGDVVATIFGPLAALIGIALSASVVSAAKH
jgi:hypothetical protein